MQEPHEEMKPWLNLDLFVSIYCWRVTGPHTKRMDWSEDYIRTVLTLVSMIVNLSVYLSFRQQNE